MFSLLLVLSAQGQRQNRPLHAEPDYLDKGWSISLGATAMAPINFRQDIALYNSPRQDSASLVYDGKLTATPKAGWMIDGHRCWMKTKFKYFDYWEVGGRYYALRGMERFNGDYPGKSSDGLLTSDLKTKFNLHTSIRSLVQGADNFFIQQGIHLGNNVCFLPRLCDFRFFFNRFKQIAMQGKR